jgi:cell division protein FtsI/penicillin-binding protein 2
MAIAAIANGGYLYRPYLVAEVQNQYGDVVYKREPELVRQVISQETSEIVTELMESVLISGTGKTAAPEGYKAAGKTGTAEKLDLTVHTQHDFIYSFVGFAPVEDPRIVLYVAVDGVTQGRGSVHIPAHLILKEWWKKF